MMPYDDDPYDDLASRAERGTGLLLALVFALAALAGWFTAEANPQGILLHTPAADGTPPVYASA